MEPKIPVHEPLPAPLPAQDPFAPLDPDDPDDGREPPATGRVSSPETPVICTTPPPRDIDPPETH